MVKMSLESVHLWGFTCVPATKKFQPPTYEYACEDVEMRRTARSCMPEPSSLTDLIESTFLSHLHIFIYYHELTSKLA